MNDAAFLHDDDAMRYTQHFRYIGADQQHGYAFGCKFFDEIIDFILGANVDANGGFIDEDDLQIAGEPLGQNRLLLVTAGELAHLNLGIGGAQIDKANGFFSQLFFLFALHKTV